ncbi:MAG: ferritin-like domain-containing protein [Acidimicrobiia bacterium]|nr:ferritin-like domain-containing protein [Acidimicrobiia bacterium]
MADDFEPHSLDQDAFLSEVHSFEFWFQAVEGYLSDRPYGHREDMPDDPDSITNRDGLVTILCNYCVGEMAALEASSGMVRLAPNNHSRIFMATQVADEARHLEVFEHRLVDLGVDDPEVEVARRANPQIVEFKRRLLALVDDGDWEAAVFAQNVLLETMEYTVFRHHAKTADPVTAETLEGVISDERRHLGFGENDVGRRLAQDRSGNARLLDVRRDLDPLVLGVFDAVFDDLSVPSVERPRLGREYLDAVERLGLTA